MAGNAYGELLSDAKSFDSDMGWQHGNHEMDLPTINPIGARRLAEARAIAEAESRNWQTLSSSSDDGASVADERGGGRCSAHDGDVQTAAFQLPADEPAVLYAGYAPFPVTDVNDLWLHACGPGRKRYGVQGAHLNLLGLFLHTSTLCVRSVLSACPPS
jgi:hypothetical protein